jgi:hypothetical protein
MSTLSTSNFTYFNNIIVQLYLKKTISWPGHVFCTGQG